MIHAVIIDDEEHGIKSLELLLEKFCPDVTVVGKSSDPRKGIDLINKHKPEIVFLDIYMPELNGFDVLEQLNFRNFYLIFTTAYREFALKALKSNAFDYLLKPIDWEELQKAVEKVKTKKSHNNKIAELLQLINNAGNANGVKVLLPTKTGVERVMSTEISYIEAQSNYSFVQLVGKTSYTTTKSLKEYEEQLCSDNHKFYRVQHSFIVNINEVVRYTKEDGGYISMRDGKKIPVSKFHKKEFLGIIRLEGS